jgi:hypothetical protein
MLRLLSGTAGTLLVVIPPVMLYGITVPVPRYQGFWIGFDIEQVH